MTISTSIHFLERPVVRNLLGHLRRGLGGRRALWLVAGLAFAAGLALKWNWLVAAGIAPVLVSLLPCAAMCALGFCAHKMSGAAAAKLPPDEGAPGGADRAG